MPYVQITPSQRQQMLRAIGVESVEGLFCGVPEPLRLDRPLSLPAAVSEQVLMAELAELIAHNRHGGRLACFAGGGAYDHFIPAVVDAIASRGEFLTAYTPYQPEASQGSLQAFFEFQTLICQLTGMAVANASMYEAASALAEAILMLTGPSRQRVIVCEPIHPHYLATVRTYLVDSPVELVVVPQAGGSADAQGLMVQLTADTAAVVVQSPNFYGVIERGLACLSAAVHESGAALVQVFDPISLALLKGPGQLGADVAVGEGQALGIPLSFGGPYLGLLAVAEKHLRRMPGRLVGQTVDAEGRTAYCLTLQTREQHIRRDKATSNICTNEGLCALRAAVYLAAMGPHGLKRAATLSMQRAHELAGRIGRLGGYEVLFADKPFFREFVVRCKRAKPEAIIDAGLDAGVLAGVPMGPFDEEMADCMLIACTEKRSLEQIDTLVGVFKKMSKAGPAK